MWEGKTRPPGAICRPGDPREQLLQGEAHHDWRGHTLIGRRADRSAGRASGAASGMDAGRGPAQAPPLPEAALNAGPPAPPPSLLAAAISAVPEQLRGGLGGPALRQVSASGLCRGLGPGDAAAGRVTERWEAPLSRPQFPLMAVPAPSQPELLEGGGQDSLLVQGARGVYCSSRAPLAQPQSHRKSPPETELRMRRQLREGAHAPGLPPPCPTSLTPCTRTLRT